MPPPTVPEPPELAPPTCGRIVHYLLPGGPRRGCRRPLLVTSAQGELVSGHVFIEPADHPGDHPAGLASQVQDFGQVRLNQQGQLVLYVQDVPRAANAGDPGAWDWPQRV